MGSSRVRGILLLASAFLSWTVFSPVSASAAPTTDAAHPVASKPDCRDWGVAAVRNWLTDKCPAPSSWATYRTHLTGGGGVWIRGVVGGDRCTASPDKPMGRYDFRPACDMHDYGILLMEHGQLKKTQMNLTEINSFFATVLHYGVCGAYQGEDRATCRRLAKSYGYGVQLVAGSPFAPV